MEIYREDSKYDDIIAINLKKKFRLKILLKISLQIDSKRA